MLASPVKLTPVAAICYSIAWKNSRIFTRAAGKLAAGICSSVAITALFIFLARHAQFISPGWPSNNAYLDPILEGFGWWWFAVAAIAGVSCALSLLTNKSTVLIGYIAAIVVIPLTGYLSVSLALGSGDEVRGSLFYLGSNLIELVLIGALTLFVWRRIVLDKG